jgi:hypothetical protein
MLLTVNMNRPKLIHKIDSRYNCGIKIAQAGPRFNRQREAAFIFPEMNTYFKYCNSVTKFRE